MVELRKRKTPPPAPVRPAKTQKKAAPKSTVQKVKEAVKEKVEAVKELSGKSKGGPTTAPAKGASAPKVGDAIALSSFGGEVETHDGTKTTLAKLVEESKAGVVLFTYPKASTKGCTDQVCFFRDSYEPLTAGGLSIYGLSTDSPKSNTNFKTKQNLPYPLLCDPSQTLISAIGLKGPKSAKRGVFVVDKAGKVLAAEPGSPSGTVAVVKKIVDGNETAAAGSDASAALVKDGAVKVSEDKKIAETAGEVADTAAKIDA